MVGLIGVCHIAMVGLIPDGCIETNEGQQRMYVFHMWHRRRGFNRCVSYSDGGNT
jgi:hypothetical protein